MKLANEQRSVDKKFRRSQTVDETQLLFDSLMQSTSVSVFNNWVFPMTNFDFEIGTSFSCFSGLAIERNVCTAATRLFAVGRTAWRLRSLDVQRGRRLRIPDYETDPSSSSSCQRRLSKKSSGYILTNPLYPQDREYRGAFDAPKGEGSALCLENCSSSSTSSRRYSILATRRRYDPALRDRAQEAVGVSFTAING